MYADNKYIFFFDFLENHYVLKNNINVLKSSFTKEEGRAVINSSHLPLEIILIFHKGAEVKASHFKIPDGD